MLPLTNVSYCANSTPI